MFTNQLKTFPESVLIPIYAGEENISYSNCTLIDDNLPRKPNKALKTTDTMGSPFFRVYMKNLGAFPDAAKPS